LKFFYYHSRLDFSKILLLFLLVRITSILWRQVSSAFLSKPIISRLGLVFISSTIPLQPAKPYSTIASTDVTSKKGLSHWISHKSLTKNHSNSTITVAFPFTNITTMIRKVIYKQKKLACLGIYKVKTEVT